MRELTRKIRTWLWYRLVFLADRISPEDAFRATGLTIYLRKGIGWVLDDFDERKGIPVWYCGKRVYEEHAYDGYEEEKVSKG